MKKPQLLYFFTFIILFSQCADDQSETDNTLNETEQQQLKAQSDSLAQLQLLDSLTPPEVQQSIVEFVTKYNNSDEMPSTLVSVNINDNLYEIKTVTGQMNPLNKEQFAEMEIPNKAIAAIGGWWAGAGDYFYIISSQKGYEVYHGWQDEMQEDSGYHWKLEKTISVP
jgi:hypothetical protein